MKARREQLSVLDVVDNWRFAHQLESVRDLGALPISVLADLVQQIRGFYERFLPLPEAADEIRLFPDLHGGVAGLGAPAKHVAYTDDDLDEGSRGLTQRALRRAFAASFVSGDTVIGLESLSYLLSILVTTQPQADQDVNVDLEMRVTMALGDLQYLRPLVKAGILILAPRPGDFWPEERANGQWERGGKLQSTAETPAYFGASVVPIVSDRDSTVAVSRHSHKESQYHAAVALAAADLPVLAGISIDTLVRIHREEEAFVEWRTALRAAARQIHGEVDGARFASQAREVYEDLLLPRATALRRATSRSQALKRALTEEPVRALLGALFSAGGATAAGAPLSGAVASAVAGGVANLAYAGLHRPGVGGVDAILTLLLRNSQDRGP